MPTPRFSLPISWAACARWLNNSTSLRSSSSIFLRQSEISMRAVVGRRSLVVNSSALVQIVLLKSQECRGYCVDQRLTANDQRSYKLCHTLGFFARIAFNGLHNRAAHHPGIGKFPHRTELFCRGNADAGVVGSAIVQTIERNP